MSYLSFLSKEFKLYLDTLKQDLKNRHNKDFFAPFGTQVHCGRQGSGKTISAVTTRSEERRVGKECRSRWSPYH